MVPDEQKKQQTEPELDISKRRLPHWNYQNSIYFVTWRLNKNQNDLISEERTLITWVCFRPPEECGGHGGPPY
jgi:hypothetical protein